MTILIAALLSGGCSTVVDHPSLAPRAVERLTAVDAVPTVPLRPPLPEDATQQERAAALVKQARTGDASFREGLAQARAAVAQGSTAAPGSEGWVQAQQAVSRADTLRTPVVQSLSDLDALQIAGAQSGLGSDTSTAIANAIAEVDTIDGKERDAIRALTDQLSQP